MVDKEDGLMSADAVPEIRPGIAVGKPEAREKSRLQKMNLRSRLLRAYFNYVYNPVYDFTIGHLNPYQALQKRCVAWLDVREGDRLLCVGLGTGNEILHVLDAGKNVDIVGIDYSPSALRRAHMKAWRAGKTIDCRLMDARCLEFGAGSFDRVLCIHLMDFVEEAATVTGEILRVLKDGGRFVITYPSGKENTGLGIGLLKEEICKKIRPGRYAVKAILDILVRTLVGVVYLPLLFRPRRRPYALHQVKAMVGGFTDGDFEIEADALYRDFIVCGRKSS